MTFYTLCNQNKYLICEFSRIKNTTVVRYYDYKIKLPGKASKKTLKQLLKDYLLLNLENLQKESDYKKLKAILYNIRSAVFIKEFLYAV